MDASYGCQTAAGLRIPRPPSLRMVLLVFVYRLDGVVFDALLGRLQD
jgi:hypothetical protein